MVVALIRTCAVCGKDFIIHIDEQTKKILTRDVFYGGVIRFGIGMWSKYRMEGTNPDGTIKWVKVHPWYVELKYKLIDFKRWLFHQYEDVEYWECPNCNKKVKKRFAKKNNRKKQSLAIN